MTKPPEEPEFVDLALPTDTIELTATDITWAMMQSAQAPDGIASYLLVHTHELGAYKLRLTDDCAARLMEQYAKVIALGGHLVQQQAEDGEQ